MKGLLRNGAIVVALGIATPAFADYPCASLAGFWRRGRIGLLDGRPIVTNGLGKAYFLARDSDSEWSEIDIASAPPQSPEIVSIRWETDQWEKPSDIRISIPKSPPFFLTQIAKDISDKEYPNRWAGSDQYRLRVGTRTTTISLPGVYAILGGIPSPRGPSIVYLLTSQPSGEDGPCGLGDGPGLIEIDLKALQSRMLFVDNGQPGIWSIAFNGDIVWMLTSAGVCQRNFSGGKGQCWSYHYGEVTKDWVVPILDRWFARKKNSVTSLEPLSPGKIKIVGGRVNGRDGVSDIQIEHPRQERDRNVYVKIDDIKPILSRD